ncbi:hypothetical protein [Austwickia chelonae]|uniref:hypothetical protein n=1 Tax=Austwickia chelonae TaxID=100225 RepID=UPI00030896D2|nr:hypothetical protein [Austwickia chelonae]
MTTSPRDTTVRPTAPCTGHRRRSSPVRRGVPYLSYQYDEAATGLSAGTALRVGKRTDTAPPPDPRTGR